MKKINLISNPKKELILNKSNKKIQKFSFTLKSKQTIEFSSRKAKA